MTDEEFLETAKKLELDKVQTYTNQKFINIEGITPFFFMTIETTVLDFKLSKNFEEYKAHMNAPEQQAMFKEMGVKTLLYW